MEVVFMNFIDYTKKFMDEILVYYNVVLKMKEWNPESETIEKILEKLKDEYLCDEGFKDVTPEKFLENEWVKFQMLLAYYYSKHFYGEDHVFKFTEFISIRDMVESVLMEKTSDQSVYTRVVNILNIPLEEIPKHYVQILYISDEFMYATNYILKVLHEEFENPVNCFTVDEYRAKIGPRVEKVIADLNETGYFGTYEKDYLLELMIAYRLGFPVIGPLYITSKFPKNPNKLEDLKNYVNTLWDRFKSEGTDQQ
jgi:hypothetical protein